MNDIYTNLRERGIISENRERELRRHNRERLAELDVSTTERQARIAQIWMVDTRSEDA